MSLKHIIGVISQSTGLMICVLIMLIWFTKATFFFLKPRGTYGIYLRSATSKKYHGDRISFFPLHSWQDPIMTTRANFDSLSHARPFYISSCKIILFQRVSSGIESESATLKCFKHAVFILLPIISFQHWNPGLRVVYTPSTFVCRSTTWFFMYSLDNSGIWYQKCNLAMLPAQTIFILFVCFVGWLIVCLL